MKKKDIKIMIKKSNVFYQKNKNCCSINYHFLYYMRLTIYEFLRTKLKSKYIVKKIIHEAFKTKKLFVKLNKRIVEICKIEYTNELLSRKRFIIIIKK